MKQPRVSVVGAIGDLFHSTLNQLQRLHMLAFNL